MLQRRFTPQNFAEFAPLFTKCCAQTQSQILLNTRPQNLLTGQKLFNAGDIATHIYIVAQGWFKLIRYSQTGHEVVLDVLGPGHIIADMAAFEKTDKPSLHHHSAEALDNAQIWCVLLALLSSEIYSNGAFAMSMLHYVAQKYQQKDQEIELQILQTAPQRLGCFLLRFLGTHTTKTQATIHLACDKSVIAARLGMSPETFSRALAKLKKEAAVVVKGQKITLQDTALLKRFTCGACSHAYGCTHH